jgi:hypothetical protein
MTTGSQISTVQSYIILMPILLTSYNRNFDAYFMLSGKTEAGERLLSHRLHSTI